MHKTHEIVPIGCNCAISHFTRHHGLRRHAYPFDWNVTPITSAVDLIETAFDGFLEEEELIFLPSTPRLLFDENDRGLHISEEVITPVICRRYAMLFPHDFSSLAEEDLSKVKRKYRRRIERFLRLLETKQPLLFVYTDCELNDWQRAQYDLARVRFPHKESTNLARETSRLKALAPTGSSVCSLTELKSMLLHP